MKYFSRFFFWIITGWCLNTHLAHTESKDGPVVCIECKYRLERNYLK